MQWIRTDDWRVIYERNTRLFSRSVWQGLESFINHTQIISLSYRWYLYHYLWSFMSYQVMIQRFNIAFLQPLFNVISDNTFCQPHFNVFATSCILGSQELYTHYIYYDIQSHNTTHALHHHIVTPHLIQIDTTYSLHSSLDYSPWALLGNGYFCLHRFFSTVRINADNYVAL